MLIVTVMTANTYILLIVEEKKGKKVQIIPFDKIALDAITRATEVNKLSQISQRKKFYVKKFCKIS